MKIIHPLLLLSLLQVSTFMLRRGVDISDKYWCPYNNLFAASYIVSTAIGNIDNNGLGNSVNPSTGIISCPSYCHWYSIDPTQAADANIGSESDILSVDSSNCQLEFAEGNSYSENSLWQKCYDTLKYFVENCTTSLDGHSAFPLLDAAIQNYPATDTARYGRYLAWLKSVLYLNSFDPYYWCVCAEDIASRVGTVNGYLSALNWLMKNTDCSPQVLRMVYTQTRAKQRSDWLARDTSLPLDTTLPSMHDLGLDTLFGLHLLGSVPHATLFTSILQAFSLSENPFQSNTMLRFNLNSMAYVRTEVYDELGRMVLGDGSGKVYESGPHQLPIDLSKFASGVYYLISQNLACGWRSPNVEAGEAGIIIHSR